MSPSQRPHDKLHIATSPSPRAWCQLPVQRPHTGSPLSPLPGRAEYVATFRGSEFFCYDVSRSPVQSSADELALAFRTRQRHGLLLHTGRAADFLNLSLKAGAVWLVINLGAGAFEALVEPVNGKFHDGGWHHVSFSRRQHAGIGHAMVNKLHYLVVITLLLLLGFAVAPPPTFWGRSGGFWAIFTHPPSCGRASAPPHAKRNESWFSPLPSLIPHPNPSKFFPERACVTRWG
ncbi:PREDICTED: neurexin-2-like [Corvus brachyrhynchos]|uniref:neurexin-2-like n=1 Tax=Corvus brachyrhynchos TaxID=85066 RepID=UPI0008166329|nr:PREDICTED: neurexin-2-like [Corvus brachyrhynchos]